MEEPLPPLDGSLPTIPDIADYVAKQSPNSPWFVFPSKEDPMKSAQISCAEVVEASHRIAHILRPGRRGSEREVVALLLNTDTVLYAALLLGLLRAGFVVRELFVIVVVLELTACIILAISDVAAQLDSRRGPHAGSYVLHPHSGPGVHFVARLPCPD